MKKIAALIVFLGMSLPLMATPTSCQNSQLETADLANGLLLLANPECLDDAGIASPWR